MDCKEVIWFNSKGITNNSYTNNFLNTFEKNFSSSFGVKKHRENILNKVGNGGLAVLAMFEEKRLDKTAKSQVYFLFSIKDNKCNAYESIVYNYGLDLETIVKYMEKLVQNRLIEIDIRAEVNMLCDTKRRNWRLRVVQKKKNEVTPLKREIDILSIESVERLALTDIFKFAKQVGIFAKIKRKKIGYAAPLGVYLDDWTNLCKNEKAIIDIVNYKYNKGYDSEKAMFIRVGDKLVEKWYTEELDDDRDIVSEYWGGIK